jgi:sugar/nucleoside kinase (ribokinase family)
VVRRQTDGTDRLTSIIEAVQQAARGMSGSNRLIVDAALSLGLISADWTENLYAEDLDSRRSALVEYWEEAHHALGISPIPARPTARTLRLELEDVALGILAESMVRGVSASQPTVRQPAERSESDPTPGDAPAVVIGAAVFDLFFSLAEWPDKNRSAQSLFSTRYFGGKGLNQAVQLARLKVPVTLISAIAADSDGEQLLKYLIAENIDAANVEYQERTVSPYTLVLSSDGFYFHAGSKQRYEAALTEQFVLSQSVQEAITQAPAVLLTLEPSVDVIASVINSLSSRADRPLTILTASPPVQDASFGAQELGAIDILVGTEWELQKLGSLNGSVELSIDDAIRSLTALGVGTICVLDRRTCRVYMKGKLEFTKSAPKADHPLGAVADESATGDSFAGTLAAQLIGRRNGESNRIPTEEDFKVAWSAFLATRAKPGTSPSLPVESTIRRIQALSENEFTHD